MVKDLLEHIAKKLVEKVDAVQVSEKISDDLIALELRVAANDFGKVIGKEGKTARSMRTLLALAGERLGKRVTLEIVE